jgi:cytochrome d ubiquinol oxidase subunit II
MWTLFATGRLGQRQRALIDRAIGPIWEANHVWLIIAVTILFTAFPAAFAMISTRLHIPLTLMLIGIVLRGTAFAVRTHDVTSKPDGFTGAPPIWHRVFGWSSLFTPAMLGLVLGSIASGRAAAPSGSFVETFIGPWLAPFPAAVALLTSATVAYLAAVYLLLESRDPDLAGLFRRRSLLAWTLVTLLAGISLWLTRDGAPEIYHGLLQTGFGRTAVAVTMLLHTAALWSLVSRRDALARALAAAGAVAMLWGWAASQFPYLVEPSVTIYDAAPPATLRLLFYSLCGGSLLLFPFLYILYKVFKSEVIAAPGTPADNLS